MPISLTTIGAGAAIDATVLRTRVATIERYVNEQVAAGDRTTNWLDTVHVFAPDFQYGGGAGPRVVMPGGEVAWCERTAERAGAALFYFDNSSGFVPVPGLCRTLHFPETPTAAFRVSMCATFYAFEYGGTGAAPNGARDEASTAAQFGFFLDGNSVASSYRKIMAASDTNSAVGAPYSGQIYARKQVVMFHVEAGSVFTAPGIHHVEVRCIPVTPGTPATPEWKHIFVVQGRLAIRHRLR
jgi:hypothetical protein